MGFKCLVAEISLFDCILDTSCVKVNNVLDILNVAQVDASSLCRMQSGVYSSHLEVF